MHDEDTYDDHMRLNECSNFYVSEEMEKFGAERQWCSGNINASHALAPGSIPGWRIFLQMYYIHSVFFTHSSMSDAHMIGFHDKFKFRLDTVNVSLGTMH